MEIKQAIELLKRELKAGKKHVVLAYWCADAFGMKEEDDEWPEMADIGDDIDWSNTHGQISYAMENDGENEPTE